MFKKEYIFTLWQLIRANFINKYRRTHIGLMWAILVPLFTVIIYYIVFSYIIKIKLYKISYFIYLLTGILPWKVFQESLTQSVTVFVDNKNFIQKFPLRRELLPLSIVLENFMIYIGWIFIMLLFFMIVKVKISKGIIFLPGVIFLHMILTIGLVMIFSSLYVVFRDIRYILEILLLVLFFGSPIFYPMQLVGKFLKIYLLNPFTGIINLYRVTLLETLRQSFFQDLNFLNTLIVPSLFSIMIYILGKTIFKYLQDKFDAFLYIKQ